MATCVLLHGAYQGGWIWQRVAPHLRAAGHTVFTPTLDGCAERRHALRPGIDTESQAAEISELLFYDLVDLPDSHRLVYYQKHDPAHELRKEAPSLITEALKAEPPNENPGLETSRETPSPTEYTRAHARYGPEQP